MLCKAFVSPERTSYICVHVHACVHVLDAYLKDISYMYEVFVMCEERAWSRMVMNISPSL